MPDSDRYDAGSGVAVTDLFGDAPSSVRAYGSHESTRAQNDEWLTPRHIIDALGPFDLDPCALITRPWDTAAQHYTIADDGMRQPWHGYVWMNPPYTDWRRWMHRLAEHGNGVALIFARTETRDFSDTCGPKLTRCCSSVVGCGSAARTASPPARQEPPPFSSPMATTPLNACAHAGSRATTCPIVRRRRDRQEA